MLEQFYTEMFWNARGLASDSGQLPGCLPNLRMVGVSSVSAHCSDVDNNARMAGTRTPALINPDAIWPKLGLHLRPICNGWPSS